MTTTPRLGLAYLVASQAQKEVTHNEALNDVDALMHCAPISKTLNTPPSTPAEGDTYIVGSAPTGAWSGQAGKLALYYGGWRFKTPKAGWMTFLASDGRLYLYDGSAWVVAASLSYEASLSWTPSTIASASGVTSAAITITGAAFGDYVLVAAPYDLQGVQATAYVSAAGTVKIRLSNLTGAGVTLGAGSWRVRLMKG